MVMLFFSCSVKKTEQLKETIKDKSQINIDENYQGKSSESLTNYNSFVIDTSSIEDVIITFTNSEKTRDSLGNEVTKVNQTKIKKSKKKRGINQYLNANKLELKQDSSSSSKTKIKNDINKSTKTKETASSNKWFNLLWFFVPLGLIIYWRFFKGR